MSEVRLGFGRFFRLSAPTHVARKPPHSHHGVHCYPDRNGSILDAPPFDFEYYLTILSRTQHHQKVSLMHPDTLAFNNQQAAQDATICHHLAALIDEHLPEAENKIWHRHPVWFLDDNPIVGYSKLKAGIRLMFWSGVSFEEEGLNPGTGKFKDASRIYTASDEINDEDLGRWISKGRAIQWDYKNIYKRKGQLVRLNPESSLAFRLRT
ncbi:MAG: DUF1801 domain-containing protein [Bacteroidota bacterium]